MSDTVCLRTHSILTQSEFKSRRSECLDLSRSVLNITLHCFPTPVKVTDVLVCRLPRLHLEKQDYCAPPTECSSKPLCIPLCPEFQLVPLSDVKLNVISGKPLLSHLVLGQANYPHTFMVLPIFLSFIYLPELVNNLVV